MITRGTRERTVLFITNAYYLSLNLTIGLQNNTAITRLLIVQRKIMGPRRKLDARGRGCKHSDTLNHRVTLLMHVTTDEDDSI